MKAAQKEALSTSFRIRENYHEDREDCFHWRAQRAEQPVLVSQLAQKVSQRRMSQQRHVPFFFAALGALLKAPAILWFPLYNPPSKV